LFPLWGAVSLSMRIIGIKEGRNQKMQRKKREVSFEFLSFKFQ